MILLYFLIVFVFFLSIMQWVFRRIDARHSLSTVATAESFLSTEQRANTRENHQKLLKRRTKHKIFILSSIFTGAVRE